MKAVILCAGKGKRLRPFSYTIPKHLLPVNNKPVLRYLLDELAEINEIKEVAMIVSQETYNPIKEYISINASELPFQFSYCKQDIPLGLAHACLMAKDFVQHDEFLLLLGDNIIPGGVKSILSPLQSAQTIPDATVLVRKVLDPRSYGVVEFDSIGNILSMEEKPLKPKSDYVIVGIYRFNERIFDSIANIKPSFRGELEITDAIFYSKNLGQNVYAKIFDGFFLDIGNPESYLSANQFIREQDARLKKEMNPNVVNSSVSDNVSIGFLSQVIDSKLENCIILDGTKIINSYLKNSIIGKNCIIDLGNLGKEPISIIVGDDSILKKGV